jgi:RNA polymerase sigma-70 factor (ECF subfamily)
MSQSDSDPVHPVGHPDLNALIKAVGRGEPGAFDTLFRRLYRSVYRTALAVIRDPAQAEEVAQEVFMEVWRAAGQFDPAKGSAEAWVLTIARRRAIDRVRSAASAASRDQHHSKIQASWDQVSEAVQDILDRERLRYSLDKLTGPQRQVITLAFYGGHTHTEVAAILGIAVGTVKSRIRTGLTRLRESMTTK